MKIRNNIFLIAALCLAVFCLSTCGDADGSGGNGQGTIIINFGNSNARYVVNKEDMKYTITLTSLDNKTTIPLGPFEEREIPITRSVPEGTWNVKVKANGYRVTGRQAPEGGVVVPIIAGETVPKTIDVTVTGTRVYEWDDLVKDFKDINDGYLKNLSEIVIEAETITAYSSNYDKADDAIFLTREQTIYLKPKTTVTITRDEEWNDDLKTSRKILDNTVFTITNGTLVLDGSKGSIIIDGNKNNIKSGGQPIPCNRALINVGRDGTLKMYGDVFLRNNETDNGGGVWVGESGARFEMHGGYITGNTARSNGGGVYVKEGATFIMAGGEISNNTANTATGKGGGVCIDNDYNGGTFIKEGGTVYGSDNEAGDKGNTARYGNSVNDGKSYDNTSEEDDKTWPKP